MTIKYVIHGNQINSAPIYSPRKENIII